MKYTMNNIRVIIIDDEPPAVEVIKELITFTTDLEVVGVAHNGLKGIQTIIQNKPDLVFLDVDMPMINGLDLMDKIPNKDFEIIFTTGSATHALKAIKMDAVDYLLKPIDPAEFLVAVEKCRIKLQSKRKESNKQITPRKLQLPSQHGIIYISEEDIVHIDGKGSYSEIAIVGNDQKITVSKNIGQWQEKLSENFFRCHNSHIVNLMHVKSFLSKNGFFVVMINDSQVEVSRRNKEELLHKLSHIAR